MCFTVLLSSWLIFHGTRFVATASVPISNAHNAPPVENISLIFYKNPNVERSVKADEVQRYLSAISNHLRSVDALVTCESEVPFAICLSSTKCPGEPEWNQTEDQDINTRKCSILTYATDTPDDRKDSEHESEKPTATEVWGFGMLSVGIISLSGLFGGLLWPFMSSKYYDHAMRMLIGLAVGTLTATSTMQLVPQGFGLKETEVDIYLKTSVIILSSLWSLYMFEITCKIFFHSGKQAEHQTELSTQTPATINEDESRQKEVDQEGLLPTIVTDSTNRKLSLKPYFSSTASLNNVAAKKDRKPSLRRHSHIQMGGMAPIAWMVILGDGLHNFVDGMSIGAGFSNSLASGLSISIAIACEEFPHELGDFAILVNSGMPIKRALMYNFLSALTAVAGLVLGILLGELEASTYIFSFSGGLFLYISLTDLMPELNAMIEEGLKKSKQYALLILLQQNCGILFGFCLLYFISANPVTIP